MNKIRIEFEDTQDNQTLLHEIMAEILNVSIFYKRLITNVNISTDDRGMIILDMEYVRKVV